MRFLVSFLHVVLSCLIMADFDVYMSQGQKLGLSDQKLIDYIQQCEDRAQRQKQKELDREIEKERIEQEREERERERQHELEMKKLDLEATTANSERSEDHELSENLASGRNVGLKPTYIPKLPAFDEKNDEIDSFFIQI